MSSAFSHARSTTPKRSHVALRFGLIRFDLVNQPSHHRSVPEIEAGFRICVTPRGQEACDMVEKAGLSCAKVISISSEL